ncbi:MAG: hypothetical protein CME06_02165 [Gemmatimonadetes bacterium]|nr:hypothetical protein [Gemmatimonadota bacterium]
MNGSRKGRSESRKFRLTALALACIVPLGLGELALRLARFDPYAAMRSGRGEFLRPSDIPGVHYELRPGATGPAWGTRVAVNSDGFRGEELDPVRRDRVRILVIGDSIAFGNRLAEGLEFPARLRTLLLDRLDSVEVLNLAVTGYDTVQEVAALEARLEALDPDWVVLQYCLNDAGVHTVNLDFTTKMRRLERAGIFHLRIVQFFVQRLDGLHQAESVALQNDPERFRAEYAALIDPIAADETTLRSMMAAASSEWPSSWYRDEARVGRIRHAFQRLAELSVEHEFGVLALVVPGLATSAGSPTHRVAEEIVSLELARAGLEEIDVRVEFGSVGLLSLRLDPDDPIHPGAKGHEILARAIADGIVHAVSMRANAFPFEPPI